MDSNDARNHLGLWSFCHLRPLPTIIPSILLVLIMEIAYMHCFIV
jgi:hypothetical protein